MGRPEIASSKRRSVIRSVRLTPAEAAVLERRYGSVSKALRALVDAHLRAAGQPR